MGRESELDWLLERVRQAARGRPRACLVRGEAGIGKSRLLGELGRQALGEGLHVWSLRGSPDVQTPYLALDALIQDLALRCLCGPALAEAGARWWDELRRSDGRDATAPALVPSGPSRRALSLAFQRALLERAGHGGFLLLIDDLQWLDGPSFELIAEATAAVGDKATEQAVCLGLVIATRTAAPRSTGEAAERRLEFELICDAVELQGLGEQDTEAFLRALGLDPPARELAGRLREVSRGNPARLRGLVWELQRRGALRQRGRSWIATLDPLEIDEEKSAHLDLPHDAPLRQTLRVLGLFNGGGSPAALAAVTGAAPDSVESQLTDAEARGWLTRRAGRFCFEDAALGRALSAELEESARREFNHRVARFLEAVGEGDPETFALHWHRAWPDAPPEKVLAALRTAAQQAMRAREWRRAASHFERALHVAEQSGIPVAERAELHYRAGLAHFRSLDGEPSRAHFERAADLYGRAADPIGLVRARVEAMRAEVSLSASVYGSRPRGLEDIGRLVEGLDDSQKSLRAYAFAEMAEAHAMARDSKSAEQLIHRAVACAEQASDDVRCIVQAARGIVLTGSLDLTGAEQAYRESIRLGRRTGDAWLESIGLNRLPIALAWQGRLDEARSYLLAAGEATEATGDWADYSLALGTLAALSLARGEFEEVESFARQAVSCARRSGYSWGAALAISAVAPARALRGRLAEARDAAAMLETPGALAREIPPMWGAVSAVLRLRLAALAGTADASAHEQAGGLVELLLGSQIDPQTLPALCACVEIAANAGDPALAARAAAVPAEAARRGVVFTPALDEILQRTLGLSAEVSGRREEAISRFEEALEAAERGGARVLQARIHADLARVLGAEGRDSDAMRNAERALALADRLNLEPLNAAWSARFVASRPSHSARERTEILRTEERRLLRGIADGFQDSALASDLLLTPEGVVRLRQQLFERIGASSRLEATAFAHREGLIAPARAPLADARAEIMRLSPPVRTREPRPLTVFVSDIANSSELIQRFGDEAAQAVIQEHNRIARACFRAHSGVELQHTGDGFIASFESASEALRCSVALQCEFASHRFGSEQVAVLVRVGLHTGEVLLEEGRLFGMVMHTAARICGACRGGEILMSHQVWRALDSGVDLVVDDLGLMALRGILEPVSLHRVRWVPHQGGV